MNVEHNLVNMSVSKLHRLEKEKMHVQACITPYHFDYNSQSLSAEQLEDLRRHINLIKKVLQLMRKVNLELEKSQRQMENQLEIYKNRKLP
ncbi:uncharacterized protein LOC118063790 [Chelonus insularis]|uniref:uncharacterized protein LOC118063790 n=1 Tax=Chelonus insularis TaxID=460826 RepID=UPI0020CA16A1|nr:uncharacterized protein LOC118063790 [Chelonus insularis]KAG8148358.1 CinsV16.8_orph1 protein [Chelonus insularis]